MKRLFIFNELVAFLILAAGVGASGAALAQAAKPYPQRPIRLVIGFAPGGPADIAGRAIGPKLSEVLGQQLIIDNRGGAGGTIGLDAVAKAAPDGYTLGLASSGNLVMAPQLYPNIPYNVLKDITAITQLATSSYVLAVNPSMPAKSVAEFVKLAKSRKPILNYGSSGTGSTSHIAAELLRGVFNGDFVHVPYKGTGPALTAVVSGEIDMMIADLTPARPLADSGRLRLIAAVGSKRSSAMPQLVTMVESGVKMQPVDGRYGIVAPAGTSREIITRLHSAIINVLKLPDVQQRYGQIGFDIIGDTPEHFSATIKSEGEIFGDVIRKAGIKPD